MSGEGFNKTKKSELLNRFNKNAPEYYDPERLNAENYEVVSRSTPAHICPNFWDYTRAEHLNSDLKNFKNNFRITTTKNKMNTKAVFDHVYNIVDQEVGRKIGSDLIGSYLGH